MTQVLPVAAAERVHILYLFVAVCVLLKFLVFAEVESCYGESDEDQKAGRYEHDDNYRAVGEVAVGCSVVICAS